MKLATFNVLAGLFMLCVSVLLGCREKQAEPPSAAADTSVPVKQTFVRVQIPLGLPDLIVPDHNPLTKEKIELGRELFFDKNLSLDRTMSCATCHDPEKAWANEMQFAVGVSGESGNRNVPTVINAAYYHRQFWDGRSATLESQALGPLTNPIEMALESYDDVISRIRENADYVRQFRQAFPNGLTIGNVGRAIASFERTVLVGNTPYDRFVAGDESALSPAARRGLEVFRKRGRCAGCHTEPLLTDNQFYNLGIGMDSPNPDVGRFAVTKLPSNIGRFKTPTLRNVTKTAPYMHDGSVKTLEEVIDIYDKGGLMNPHLSDQLKRLQLTDSEKSDLLVFLREGLTSSDKPPVPYDVLPADEL